MIAPISSIVYPRPLSMIASARFLTRPGQSPFSSVFRFTICCSVSSVTNLMLFIFNTRFLIINSYYTIYANELTYITAFSISISYLFIYANVGKGLPTYCGIRAVGRQPFAANDKQSNQSTLKTLYAWKTMKLIRIVHEIMEQKKNSVSLNCLKMSKSLFWTIVPCSIVDYA